MTASEFGSMDPMQYPTDLHVLKAWLANRCIDVEMKEHKLYTGALEFSPVFARIAGTDHLIAALDLPTLMGRDSDDAIALGENLCHPRDG